MIDDPRPGTYTDLLIALVVIVGGSLFLGWLITLVGGAPA